MNTSKRIKITAAIIFAIFIIVSPAHADMWVIEPGYVGIGKPDPENPLEIVHSIENIDDRYALKIDLTLGGTISGGDKENAGILVDIIGDSLPGDSHHTIVGTKNDLSLLGQDLDAYGTGNFVNNDGTQQTRYAVGSLDGVKNTNTGGIDYGVGNVSEIQNKHDGTISLGFGQMSIIEQASSTGEITAGFGYHATLKNESGGTFSDGILYYGEFLGSFPPDGKLGISLVGEDQNYFSGRVGIGTGAPAAYKLVVGGDVFITGKTTHYGGVDPPYILYDYETRKSVVDRVMDDVPTEKLRGAVMYFNGETSQMELFLPDKGEFRRIDGELLDVTQPIAETYETEDHYFFDEKTGKVKTYKVKKERTDKKKYKIKEDHFLDHKTGRFFKKIRNDKGIVVDKVEVLMEEAVE